jgi:hypothetical protein
MHVDKSAHRVNDVLNIKVCDGVINNFGGFGFVRGRDEEI